MELNKLAQIIYKSKELLHISKKLTRYDTLSCNVGLTPRQEKTTEKLEALADELIKGIDPELKAYHQSDPRGIALYIITKEMDNTNYSSGIAIY